MPRKNVGPGPGKYLLPPVIGYSNHDASKYRNPQYSMATNLKDGLKLIGPGPRYDIANITRYGRATPPAYSIKSRHIIPCRFNPPGPGTYKVEQVPRMKESRPPVYSLSFRYPPVRRFNTPGPDKYEVPSTLGPKVPDKNALAAYSMSYKHEQPALQRSPGPAKYTGTPTNLYKNKLPNYTMAPRVFPPLGQPRTPGPIYFPKLPPKPGYLFGLRVDTDPYITTEDITPCVQKQKSC